MGKQDFINAGFNVIDDTNNENPLLDFIRENYPQIIRDNEIRLDELKSALGMPVDEKVNGYGLNFIGRNVAKGKYSKEPDKILKINTQFSRNFDKTQNLVLKGDNLDCLKILKSYYSGKIKCIYIDPPYNTDKEDFVYPDKFDKEEAEILGLASLTESDMDRLEFSFKTKKSHNGWLTFMYPRLMLARDLLSDDGVIFVSIDDNEQANLKLLMDDVFGEENFVANIIWQRTYAPISMKKYFSESHEYLLAYTKQKENFNLNLLPRTDKQNKDYKNPDNDPRGVWKGGNLTVGPVVEKQVYEIIGPTGKSFFPPKGYCWRFTKEKFEELRNDNRIWFGVDGNNSPLPKLFLSEVQDGVTPMTLWTFQEVGHNQESTRELRNIFNDAVFTNPKPLRYIERILRISTNKDDIILDFFAGSGTTAHTVMQLNANEENSNRKFILCQIDEPIKENTAAYKFCKENSLPTFISSITCERIKRAGDKIKKEIEEKNAKAGMFEENKQQIPDIGFRVFDLTDSPKLAIEDNGQVALFDNMELTPLDRIYNLIFKIGIDDPTTAPTEIVKDCMYHHGSNYYITNSIELDKPENRDLFKSALQNGRVYIDGWTATLNTTLQETKDKEDRGKISIVF